MRFALFGNTYQAKKSLHAERFGYSSSIGLSFASAASSTIS